MEEKTNVSVKTEFILTYFLLDIWYHLCQKHPLMKVIMIIPIHLVHKHL